ncbi:protein stum-like isoform X1 [Hermetia illucens]|uniref:protein stum-like isoform X1 n=1 Tax=Hermetia illucens TaxID=343691 RepID=UPI0018CC5D4A|nr:protein stum-like isoform X1 [Hermetia illucens]
MKREPSNLKREPSNLKREPSNLNRESSNLKREPSNLKREPSNLKREGSRISLKKSSSNPKMDTGTKAAVVKKRSDSNLNKKLEKKGSFRIEKAAATMADESDASTIPVDSLKEDGSADEAKPDKLIPLTKANVISMTTAAITAQPVQITTSITNQIPLTKSNSSNQLLSSSDSSGPKQDMKDMDPVTILEKSQKTLETIQKTVAEATEEIQKTINENLTDLKTLEGDIGRISDDSAAPFEKSDSLTTILENPASKTPTAEVTTTSKTPDGGEAVDNSKSPAPPSHPIEANVSVLTTKKSSENLLHPNTNHNNNNMNNSSSTSSTTNGTHEDTEDMAERVSERAISVLPEVECESANLQSYELHNEEDVQKNSRSDNNNDEGHVIATNIGADSMAKSQAGGNEQRSEGDKKDGTDGSKRDDSQEYLDDEKPKGCCGRFCSKLCMPCRRCQCCSCCRKQKTGSAKSDERIIVEEVNEKRGCFGRCCRKKKNAGTAEPQMGQKRMAPIQEERESETSKTAKKQNKCCLCLGKVFCCRKTNKVETITGDAEEVRRCCFCIPCGKKKKPTNAWPERRESIISDPPPQPGCCTRLCTKIFCCCRKPKPVSESRRTSMNSKKQSIAPTIPLEDSRPKLHNDLVEYNSKMKGAIPVMPLWLAWFCMICNCIIPGFGTILSGFFCLCVGIPRFSQYDSAKARIGSLIINCIVGIAQAFCVLFCFVGWGWSIWWGLIMLKTARKLRKIRRVEELEMQEEQRQQAAEKARIERDIEAQKKEEKK